MLIASFFSFFTIPFSGYLSDRIGRKQIYIFGGVATGLFAFAYYAMLDTAIPGLILLATLVAYFFHNLMWGSLAALTAECFTPRLRYSGASIGFQFAAVFAGGPAPMIATALLAWSGFRARSPLRSRLERRRADDLPAVAPTDFGRSADPTAPRKTLRTRPGCSGTAHGRFRRWCASRYAARRAVPGSTEAQLRGQPA